MSDDVHNGLVPHRHRTEPSRIRDRSRSSSTSPAQLPGPRSPRQRLRRARTSAAPSGSSGAMCLVPVGLRPRSRGCKREARIANRRAPGMYALFTEVNADESNTEAGREFLPEYAVTAARDNGAKGGYWLAPQGGRGVAIVVFDTEAEARA